MAQKFKFMRTVGLSYEEQGECYFTCQRYAKLDRIERERIESICRSVSAGDDVKRQAILAYMTTRISWRETCARFYVSDSTLDRLRRRFYELWKAGS